MMTEKKDAPLNAAIAAHSTPIDGAGLPPSTGKTELDDGTAANANPNAPAPNRGVEEDLDSEPEDKAKLGNFWRLLSYGTALDKFLMVMATLSSGGAGVALPLMNIVFGNLAGDFTGYFTPSSTQTMDGLKSSISKNALYLVYLWVGKFVLSYISMYSFRMTGIRISAAIRLAYLNALYAQPIKELDKLPSGQMTDLITNASNIIQTGISDKLSILIQSLSLFISAYAIAFSRSWLLTLLSSSIMLFLAVVYGTANPFFLKKQNSLNHANENNSTIAAEVFGNIRTVFSLGAEDAMKARYSSWSAEARKRGLSMSLDFAIQLAPAFFAIYANFALTFWYGVRMFSDGRLSSVGAVVTVLFSILIIVSTLGNMVVPMIGIFKAAAASTGFWKIIDAEKLPQGGLRDPEVSSQDDIKFEGAAFAYPSRPETGVLKGLDLVVPAGKITAIVGPSGSGKSTIVGLLERWYQLTDINERVVHKKPKDKDAKTEAKAKSPKKSKEKDKTAEDKTAEAPKEGPLPIQEQKPVLQNSGTIKIGQHNIESLDLKWWRTQIGLVQQEPFLFDNTIFENVAMGLIGSKWENEPEEVRRKLVKEACEEAFADEFIKRLPLQYDTVVGESGIKLSGGQRQRLAIARSIIKRPTILILDEATSAIDVKGEKIVQAALDRVSQGHTTITIAHRLSTIKKADKIVVLKEGVTVEQGTHESLLANEDGVYHSLVYAQHLELGKENDADEKDDDMTAELTKTKSSAHEDAGHDVSDPNTEYKPGGIAQTVGLFLYEQRQHAGFYFLTVFGAMAGGAAFSLQAYLFAKFIEVFQYTGQALIDRGDFWALMFFVLALGVFVAYTALGYSANHIATYVATTYRQQYFESILAKDISFYDQEENSSGTLASRLSTDPEQLREILGFNMAFPFISIFNLTGSIIISFVFGWKLTLVAMFAALPVILTAAFMRIRYEIQFEALNNKVFAHSSQFAAESIKAFRTVTSLTLEHTILSRYQGLLDEHVHKAFLRARVAVLIFALSDSIELLCMALGFWYGGQLLATREYTVVQFFVIYTAIVQGGQAAGQFLSFGPNIAKATAAGNRILSLREHAKKQAKKDPSSPAPGSAFDPGAGGGGVRIEFNDVSFQYPTRDVPVFRGLSFKVEPGQFVAFVGPSGAGKSTIISLLERFYDVTSGSITFDGNDVRSVDPMIYRQPIALVSQEPTLFEGTIRSNLLLGLPPHTPTPSDETIYEATSAASLHTFIQSLPESYATPLSSSTHASLSGGQKQRLCIARALLRRPRLLLLDEATSSLDSQSEREVQAALEQVVGGRQMTVCVVAHRLATVQRADRIFVLGEGDRRGARVVEQGTHKELVARKGTYWAMCQAQALDR